MADLLIVEDNELTRQVFSRVATRLGHTVRTASTFAIACKEISSHPPDLVLTDWDLCSDDARSGIDVARFSLKSSPCTAVVMVTGNNIDLLKQRTHSLAISAYVRKPVDLTGLKRILNKVLKY